MWFFGFSYILRKVASKIYTYLFPELVSEGEEFCDL